MENKIPFLDVKATYTELQFEINNSVKRVLNSGWYIGGEEVSSFETEFAAFVDAKGCVGVGNGLDAITISLKALGIGKGDEVIVPSNTFIATWLAVSSVGAIPIPVEPNEETFNLDVTKLQASVTPKTKAVIVVHLYGQPADLEPIQLFCQDNQLKLIEDAAQAHGARYQGKRIGSHGSVVTWSFYPGKNLGGFGDGGAVTSNDLSLLEQIRILSNYGSPKKYVHQVQGFNSRLDPLQACVLRVKLRYLEVWNSRRKEIAKTYSEFLNNVQLPSVPNWADPVWHLFVIRHPNRQALMDHLRSRDVQTVIHYPIPPHLQSAYSGLGYVKDDFPISEKIHQEVLSLPIGPHLSEEQVRFVINQVQSF